MSTSSSFGFSQFGFKLAGLGKANYGGIYRNSGQSINPFALVNALANKLHTQSHNIFANSPVKQIIRQSGGYKVISNKGEIDCKNIVLTTNAYSLKSLLPGVTEKQFPVLSSVLVTRPLCEASASGWQQHLTAMDTRSLKYYFRLLPDNRILFGGRGAVTGRHANTKDSQKRLKEAFDQYFPNLSDLNTEYFWSGWVSVSSDSLPHVTESSHYPGVYYATGYCGSGLSYACQAGKRLAQWISGAQKKPECPVYQQEIPAFPFTGFRRTGLHLYYAWHRTFS